MVINRQHGNDIAGETAEDWVLDVLDPDQLSGAKQTMGRRQLTRKTMALLWGLRVYVILMVLLIAFQIWNALHTGA